MSSNMDKILSPIKARIMQYIDYKGIIKEEFYKKTMISSSNFKGNGKFSELGGDKIVNILTYYEDINANWLMKGEGNMIKVKNLSIVEEPPAQYSSRAKIIKSADGIPLIPHHAMAGSFDGDIQCLDYECERYVMPIFKDADFLIPVKGDSMHPKYNSGDIVACRRLNSWSFFQFGKVYLIYTDQGALLKRIYEAQSDSKIRLVSDNADQYKPFEIEKKEIRDLAIVIGLMRVE